VPEQARLNEIIAATAAQRVVAGARYAGLEAARKRGRRRRAAAKGLLARAGKDGSAARIAAAAARRAAEAGRIAGACPREMHDLISAAPGNPRRTGQMEPSRAARAAVLDALGRPRPPRQREDDADA
jgi:hypothetical protein